jgi:uncharacterized protein (TIGR02266 family)
VAEAIVFPRLLESPNKKVAELGVGIPILWRIPLLPERWWLNLWSEGFRSIWGVHPCLKKVEEGVMKPSQLQNSSSLHAVNTDPRVSNRVPLERKVVLKFHDFGGFSIEYSANVSTSGMFVKTTSPKPVGSIFIFEIWLGDERKLVHGLGEVVWVRGKDEAPDRPAGMGIAYLKLDDESRMAIGRVVERHLLETSGETTDDSRDSETTGSHDAIDGETLRPVPVEERHSGELLVLDENELQLDDPLGPTMKSGVIATQTRQASGSRSGRVVLWLGLLLAVAGGVGYLWYSGLVPIGPWLESLM